MKIRHSLLALVAAALLVSPLAIAQEQPGEDLQPTQVQPNQQPNGEQPAQPANGEQPGDGEQREQPRGNGMFGQSSIFFIVIIGAFVLMYIFSNRTRRKQEQKRRQMLDSMSKGDKVVTIGGIIGTVIEVKGDQVVVKVDETNNVRMKFVRSAIRTIGEDAAKETDTAAQ